jgi:hypothetical protein
VVTPISTPISESAILTQAVLGKGAFAMRAFISYSFRDSSLVTELANKLAQNSIEVFFAEWDIQGGDSFIQSINKGLEEYDCFLFFVSHNSIASAWAWEELSVAIVQRIEDKKRLIPIRLDDAPIPSIIKHLLYKRYPQNEEEFNSLLMDIFGISDKPITGNVPDFIQQRLLQYKSILPGFSGEQSAILRYLVSKLKYTETIEAEQIAKELHLSPTELNDAVFFLEESNLVWVPGIMQRSVYSFVVIGPKPKAWLCIPPDELGYDVLHDMAVIAQCIVANENEYATVELLLSQTELTEARVDIAGLILAEDGIATKSGIKGILEVHFAMLIATPRTREWLKRYQASH